MLRLVFRPLLVILTLAMLLVALFQVAGRITLALLDHLEPAANRLLADRGVRLSGLSGDWRMLNPVIRVERVDLPAGYLDDLVLEVDVVESVLRGTPLARRLKIGDARIDLEKHPGEPWRLAGSSPSEPLDIDVQDFLEQSNQLEFAGSVRFLRDGSEPARIGISYLGINRGGEHRHRLQLVNDPTDCAGEPASCSLTLAYHGQDRLWPLREMRARFTAASDGFLLPRTVLGISPLKIARLEVGWQRTAHDSGGKLALRTEQFDMPGDVTLATELSATVRGRDDAHRGVVDDWRVEQGDDVWSLPAVSVQADPERISVWLPELDLALAAGFLRHALAALEPAERWLGALDLRGRAHNLRVSYGRDGSGLAYAMTLSGVALEGFKGVPTVADGSGELIGFGRGLQLNLNAHDMHLAFPDVFTGEWDLPYAQGAIQAWFSPGYFGVRGLNLRAETLSTRAAGGFAMSRPPDREGQRLLLLVNTDRMEVGTAQQFVPYKLPEDLRTWLATAPRGGVLEQARLAFQGQFQEEPGELARRVALHARVRDGVLRYHEDWPVVTDAGGVLDLGGSLVQIDLTQGQSGGARLDGSRVRVVDNGAAVDVSLDAEADGSDVLAFVRTTPLRQWLAFVEPDWRAGGAMRLSGEITVPLGSAARDPAVRLRADLRNVKLALPGYRLELADLEGSVRYRYPYQIDASAVSARLFGEPVTLSARTDAESQRVHVRFAGRARPEDVWRLAGMDDPGRASGSFSYEADLGIGVAPEVTSELHASSDLAGVAVSLPAGYGKPAESVSPGEIDLEFRPDYQALRFRYRDAEGWLHFTDTPLRGALAFDSVPAAENEGAGNLVLNGHLRGFALEDVLPDKQTNATLSFPLRLQELHVDSIDVGDFALSDALLDGEIGSDGFAVRVQSTELTGAFTGHGDAPLVAELSEVNVPAGEDDAGDALDASIIAELPAAIVHIGKLHIGAEDYGSWGFALEPDDGRLLVQNLEASVRGIELRTDAPLVWDGQAGETRFSGVLDGGDLAKVLPQWGYAPSMETASARLAGTFAWDGSPLAVDLLKLRGEGKVEATEGRFLEVESGAGAQRIFSLLNFTAIAKRMTLNFGDVFGRGISFDSLNARVALNEGSLTFREPMVVEGTGSRFRVTGTVDLEHRRLDNEMIVTLPVSQSLPWYAAYVALANPLAGIGVLVGERMLRKPIEQFSSARYQISGTLDEPEVKFVSVFDVTPPETAQDGDTKTGDAAGKPSAGGLGDRSSARKQESEGS